MRDAFSMPGFTKIDGFAYETHEIECCVEIEPDEATCLTSWYVARVWIETWQKRKRKSVEVPNKHPLFDEIAQWAVKERGEELATLWDRYLADVPASKRPPYDDNAEHRTHGGRI